jgi:tetratricopeptide (TPR) repeat protein
LFARFALMKNRRTARQRGVMTSERRLLLSAAGIFALALLVFLPALANDFVSLDDSLYVYDNALVKGGLTLAGVARVFAGPECNFYHPLTMLSLMLDHQLWGLNPLGYHLTNVLVHAATAALLFLTLAAMTGARGRSAFVAAVFAVHPLRVESVAWIAERKDVLSAFFFVLTIALYAWHARRPGWGRYGAVLAVFVVGLLCKTTLVTLPALLFLLDWWPLRRFGVVPARRLVLEKLPLLALAIAATVVAMFAQKAGVIPYADYPLGSRVENAVLSYGAYIVQTFAPVGLSPFYPFLEANLAPWRVGLVAFALAGITGLAFTLRRRAPYVLLGWLWFLGVLVPMIGLVQVGAFARADRFTYLPQVGLLVALAWGAGDLAKHWRWPRGILPACAAIALLACAALTIRQIGFWRDSETLFRHALTVTHDNGLAHESLGTAILEPRRHGIRVPGEVAPARKDEAIAHLREAVRLLPGHPDAHLNLGLVLFSTKDHAEAARELGIALATMRFHARGHFLLGLLLLEKGDATGATAHLEESLRLEPANAVARNNLGALYRRAGRLDDAIAQYRAALALQPDYADAHDNLGIALYLSGRRAEAIREFQAALWIDPANANALRNLRAAQQ